ncbi:TIGR01244 family phosphatase [Rhodobacteraceae bacterium CCMM004]|nr:TIGR01244 family phosphatase [Rhodobacteraceae bacterium CCMM004]
MEVTRLDPDYGVAGQIAAKDMAVIHALGYRTVICNRPDGEAPEQELFAAIAAAAEGARLTALCLPFTGAPPPEDTVDALADAWPDLPKPVLAYCRSGARSTALWHAVKDRLET